MLDLQSLPQSFSFSDSFSDVSIHFSTLLCNFGLTFLSTFLACVHHVYLISYSYSAFPFCLYLLISLPVASVCLHASLSLCLPESLFDVVPLCLFSPST